MSVIDAPQLLTLDEVANRLRLSRRTVERLIAADLLPALRVSRRAIRVDADELEQWIYHEPSPSLDRSASVAVEVGRPPLDAGHEAA